MSDTDLPPHLRFTATWDDPHIPSPQHASKALPEWYENLPSTLDELGHMHKNTSVKMCMPFSDALKSGWVLRSPTDITFTRSDGTLTCTVNAENDDAVTSVETLSVEQPDSTENSVFLRPNALLDTGWEITTPDGYSSLVVPPINRAEIRFTPLSVFASTDTHTGSFQLPLVIEETPITIEEGDVLANVLPLRRDTLLGDPQITSYDPDSQFALLKQYLMRFNDVRTGFYRQELWTPKSNGRTFDSHAAFRDTVTATVGDEDSGPVGGGGSPYEGVGDGSRPFLPDGVSHAFCCKAKYEGVIPKPKPATEYIPDGYVESLRELDALQAKQPTAAWARDAMSLGYIIELDSALHIDRDREHGIDAFRATSDGKDTFHQHLPVKIGPEHPFAPVEVLNVFSEWSVIMEHGYSNFYSTPLNHFQRHHRSFSGIVDADWYPGEVNIPGKFTERSDSATLDRGAPITQAIPLKRDALLNYAVTERNQ